MTVTKHIITTRTSAVVVLVLSCSLCCSAFGETPTIESVWPPVGQRGTEFQLKIVGSGLTTSQQLVFYSPHLACKSVHANSDYELVATIVADDVCRLGNEPFRLLADDGFSEMKTIRITPFPVDVQIPAAKPAAPTARHNGRGGGRGSATGVSAAAKKVVEPTKLTGLNRTICGILESGEFDRYALSLKQGRKITLEVEAVRLGSELLDTVLSITSSTGAVVARADDNSLFQQDPITSFTAELDGDYVINLHESNYNGGERSYYALHVGEFPMPSVAYPAGGQVGETINMKFIGEANETHDQSIQLPSTVEAVRDFQLLAKHGDIIAPSPIPFRLSHLTNVLESEPNNEPDTQQSAELGCVAFNGILQTHGDVDCFAFNAEEGQPLLVEAFANRIGSAADTLISILDSDLESICVNDDWGSHDSRIDFYPPRTGRYYLRVTDKLATGAPNAVYRIELTKLEPNVTAFLPRPDRLSQQSQTISVPKGNRVLARIGVRRELVEGDVRLEFVDLPSGVQAKALIVPADQFWMPVVLEAKDTAMVGGQLAGMEAFLESGDKVAGGFEQIVDLVAESADQLFQSALVTRIPIAVAPSIPFFIELEAPRTSLAKSGTIDLVVNVNRKDDFKGPVRVELPFLPPWVVAEPFVVIPADRERVIYRLEARSEAAPRSWPMVATARVDTVSSTEDTSRLDGREVASEIIQLNIVDAPISGSFVNLAGEQGQSISVNCDLTRLGAMPSKLTATIEGLPNRVSAAPVEIDTESSKIEFKLRLEPDAPIGQFNSVQCRLNGKANGQGVSFIVAAGSTLKIAAPGKLFRNTDGSILSLLEVLRQQRNATKDNPK